MADLIEPRTLKGFRDYPPELMIPRERLLEKARAVYRSYGYAPIDTPALEYAEILLGKMSAEAEIQRQLYRFKDNGGRDVALRFDLTVPFARFAAQHIGKLGVPFKRYHMGPVWRGETPQAGRFREFWQCDFDTIGTESNAGDAETALVIYDLMRALGFERFEVRINNRLILNGLLEELGLAERGAALLTALDKLPKIGRDAVIAEMTEKAGATSEQAGRVLALAGMEGTNTEILDRLGREFGGNAKAADGVKRLREVMDVARIAGVPEGRLRLDLSIARGLDYYTGVIYETFLLDLPKIGSVCSGGRYDNLAAAVHEAAAAGRRRVAGIGPAAGGDGGAEAAAEDGDAGPGAGGAVQPRPARRVSEDGPAAAVGGHRRRGLPRGEESRSAVQVRGAARLPACADRRPRRVRAGRLEDQGPGAARGNDDRGGGCGGRGAETSDAIVARTESARTARDGQPCKRYASAGGQASRSLSKSRCPSHHRNVVKHGFEVKAIPSGSSKRPWIALKPSRMRIADLRRPGFCWTVSARN